MLRARRVVATALIVLMLGVSQVSDAASDWYDVARKIQPSLARVTFPVVLGTMTNVETGETRPWLGTGICTAFSINEKRGYYQTDFHCLPEFDYLAGLALDGTFAAVVYANEATDVAVIQSTIHKPALKAAKKIPGPGVGIATFGFAYGAEQPQFRAGYVAHNDFNLGSYGEHWLVFDQPFTGGMSGGPVFDHDGKVVGLVQLGDEYQGYAYPINLLLQEVGAFWAR